MSMTKQKKQDIELLLNTTVQAFEGNGRVERVITESGALATDLVIVATGIKPNTQFLEGTGIVLAKMVQLSSTDI